MNVSPPPPKELRTRTHAVIHMGPHKTGTTSIQEQVFNKRDLLPAGRVRHAVAGC